MDESDFIVDKIPRGVVQRLESLHRAGVRQLPRGEARETEATAQTDLSAESKASDADPQSALAILQEEVSGCTRCEELACSRTQTVFGVGNPNARLCFFGEAPGADEDRQGEPFVGRAGKLLTDIIQKGMGLQRGDVYILNVLKCRPPGNRNPNPDEVENCREFFEQQLEIINPEFICCLGSVAAQNLLETKTSVGKLRGKIHDYRGIKVAVTYHPAYLLRNPSAKKSTWDDIQILMREMGISIPEKSSNV
jgi:DNA polymerase